MSWLAILPVALIALLGASLLAAYVYAGFARRQAGPPSYALSRHGPRTRIDEQTEALTRGRAGQSGLVMLSSNLDAFAARVLSARAAGRSLDLMYYIWSDDLTGRLLFRGVMAAARRGVRVRILLDDIGAQGLDAKFLTLASHPNVEVRLFNPTMARESRLRRGIEMALRAFSVTRRMHNKAWIADGRVALVGGRNVGDEYFDAAEASSFRDLDLLAVGGVVGEVEQVFDDYWNSGLALPIGALATRLPLPVGSLKLRLDELAASSQASPYLERLRERLSIGSFLDPAKIRWCADARLISDPPQKVLGENGENWLMRELLPVIASARKRLEITSPYFVPGTQGTAELVKLASGGVSVAVLTNSLAATDVAAVHGGYAPYRAALLEGGILLFELKPSGRDVDISLRGSRNACLHTKAFTVDDAHGFIGSFNFDPRSASLNTEMGILFSNPLLVSEMQLLFEKEIDPAASYEVRLGADGSLRWESEKDGRTTIDQREPEASLSRRLVARIVTLLPIESQL